jgi:versiconal hemiacetal acetate esterase
MDGQLTSGTDRDTQFEADLGYRPKLDGEIDTIYKQWDMLVQGLVSKFSFNPPDCSVKREDRVIGTEGNQIRIYTPPASENSTLCVYIHGGGWALGDLDAEDAQCEEFCKRAKLVVVSIGYRLAPKHKYPVPLDDCVDGYTWAVSNASTFNASTDKVILAGGSAGANLAIATTLRLIDQDSQMLPYGLFLAVPVTMDPRAVPAELRSKYTSYVENSDTGPNTPGGMRGFAGEGSPLPSTLLGWL